MSENEADEMTVWRHSPGGKVELLDKDSNLSDDGGLALAQAEFTKHSDVRIILKKGAGPAIPKGDAFFEFERDGRVSIRKSKMRITNLIK